MVRFWLTRVEGGSMEPTLRAGSLWPTRSLCPGDPVRRGDLVVAEPAAAGRRVVKRVVGLPGERVTLDGGRVTVDGRPLAEPYASASWYRGVFDVPDGSYLLLGDRRDASDDARTWPRPYAARGELVGRLLRRHPATKGSLSVG